jgi:hypothetical protein
MPRESPTGKKNLKVWKSSTTPNEAITPRRRMRALVRLPNIIEANIISRKAERINQNVPTSNIVPKNDIAGDAENIADRRVTNTISRPERINGDLGKVIVPSEKRASAQKIIEMARPRTSKRPLVVSMDICEKGMKKTGRRVTSKKSDQKDILSSTFDHICMFFN